MPPRRRPAAGLRIDTPASSLNICPVPGPSSAAPSSAAPISSEPSSACPSSEPLSAKPRNVKQLSLALSQPSALSSTSSLAPSVTSQRSVGFRKEEDGSPTAPYADGPIQILPGVWLGSEDNARDFVGLQHRAISSILNVAKEVHPPPTLPPHFRYLKLDWSHGQQHLVDQGFPTAFAFVDAALNDKQSVLIHCQCGVSRSSTVVIALVMRWAAERSSLVPKDVWSLKGMSGAYDYVKERSKWIGPNMSLIYQLLDYERRLRPATSPSESIGSTNQDEEWAKHRQLFDDVPPSPMEEPENYLVLQEARALDKAMEDRIVARKSSRSSLSSVASSSGVGMGPAWRSKYGSRKRASSIASNMTAGSVLSEDLMEEDEDGLNPALSDSDRSATNTSPSPGLTADFASHVPPSAPAFKRSFGPIDPPLTAMRATFDVPPLPKPRRKKPSSLNTLPPVPPSPISVVVSGSSNTSVQVSSESESDHEPSSIPRRLRTESRKPAPAPLHLRNSVVKEASRTHRRSVSQSSQGVPSSQTQTLLVFPPSADSSSSGMPARTPSAMTLTSHLQVPFPTSATPRVSTFQSKGRTKSFIGLAAPPTPTTAFSRVDARGYVGLEKT